MRESVAISVALSLVSVVSFISFISVVVFVVFVAGDARPLRAHSRLATRDRQLAGGPASQPIS